MNTIANATIAPQYESRPPCLNRPSLRMPSQRSKRHTDDTPAARGMEAVDHAYLALLRRELTRSQARLKRAEWERDQLRAQLEKLLHEREGAGTKGRRRNRSPPRS
jgi:hypothetical protein